MQKHDKTLTKKIVEKLNDGVEYKSYKIDKPTGGKRLIEEPESELKRIQEDILRELLYKIKPHEAAYGFIKGKGDDKKGIPECADNHVGKELVIRMDIEDFFHNVTEEMIREKFDSYFSRKHLKPFGDGSASKGLDRIVNILTYQGRLAMGAPSSPAVTNIVCKELDARLQGMADHFMNQTKIERNGKTRYKHHYTYTRYADDIIVSTDNKESGTDIIPVFREKIEDSGFKLKEKKTRIMRRGRPQIVLGLVVNDKKNIPPKIRREFRARLHNIKMRLKDYVNGDNDEVIDPETGQKLDGHIMCQIKGFIAHALNIRPEPYGKRWEDEFSKIKELYWQYKKAA